MLHTLLVSVQGISENALNHILLCQLLGRVALGGQRPIVVKLSRERSVGLSLQCIVEKRRIGSGFRLAP